MRRRPEHHQHRPWPIPIGILQVVLGYLAGRPQDVLGADGYLLLLAGPTILLLAVSGKRRAAGWAVAGVCLVTLAFLATHHALGPVIPSTVTAVIYAVVHGARIPAWLSLAGLWLGWITLGLAEFRDIGTPLQELRGLGLAALLAAAAELFENRRQRAIVYRRLREEERRRRKEEQERRAGEERLRIARELHDVLAHSLSLITVRASVALELMDSNPAEVRSALVAIKESSKSGLDEVRGVLHGLRGEPAPRRPAPDLSRLDELVADARAAGLAVTLQRTGGSAEVPGAVGLAAYRVIQEALTNVIRHSQSRTAIVQVHRADWALLIGVFDGGPARPQVGQETTGSGVIGIRERAASLGGWAEAGPTPQGGYLVQVALPA